MTSDKRSVARRTRLITLHIKPSWANTRKLCWLPAAAAVAADAAGPDPVGGGPAKATTMIGYEWGRVSAHEGWHYGRRGEETGAVGLTITRSRCNPATTRKCINLHAGTGRGGLGRTGGLGGCERYFESNDHFDGRLCVCVGVWAWRGTLPPK